MSFHRTKVTSDDAAATTASAAAVLLRSPHAHAQPPPPPHHRLTTPIFSHALPLAGQPHHRHRHHVPLQRPRRAFRHAAPRTREMHIHLNPAPPVCSSRTPSIAAHTAPVPFLADSTVCPGPTKPRPAGATRKTVHRLAIPGEAGIGVGECPRGSRDAAESVPETVCEGEYFGYECATGDACCKCPHFSLGVWKSVWR